MKNLFILLLIVYGSATAFSQEYHKLLNESLYWDIAGAQMGYICSGFSENPPWRVSFSGDTVIDGKHYAKTYYREFITLTPPVNCGAFVVDTNVYLSSYYFLREDTIEERVWRYDAVNDDEVLLYDFTYEQGDTIDLIGYPSETIVDTVYYITTGDGVTRKKIQFGEYDGYPGGYYIEGIGGVAGVLDFPVYYFESGTWLMCVKNSYDNSILNIGDDCYDFLTGTTLQHSKTRIKVYFNNSISKIIIKLDDLLEVNELLLYNTNGQAIKRLYIEDFKLEYEFTVSDFPPGLYMVALIENGSVVDTRKVTIN